MECCPVADNTVSRTPKASTGIEGLDHILDGGLPRHELYLLEGGPGTGKTSAALHFLLAGVKAGERVLFLTLSQGERALQKIAAARGWSLEGVVIHEVQTARAGAAGGDQ